MKFRDEKVGGNGIPGRGSDVHFLNCLAGILAAFLPVVGLQLWMKIERKVFRV